MANYNLTQAIDFFNQDQVRIQTMYHIDFDSGLDKIDATLKRMQVYGQSFTLPDRNVTFEDIQYRAYKIPVPTVLEMGQDHDVTVYADVRGDLRRAMLDWQAACLNPDIDDGSYFEANRRPTKLGAGDGETPSITINLLAPDMQTVVEKTVIYGSRVTKVGGLELSNTAGGVSTFSVSFKSVYWQQVLGDGVIGVNNQDAYRYTTLGSGNQDSDGKRATGDFVSGNAQNLP